jgi:hypothetical protein
MDAAQIAVTLGGLGIVGFIVWFFFGPKASAASQGNATAARGESAGHTESKPL